MYVWLGLLVAALWAPRIHGPIDLRWDGSAYYVLGTSLAEGKGYRLLNEPGEIRANQYPPLLPLIIAAHQAALGTSDPVVVGRFLRLSSFLAFLAYIFSIYVLLRRNLPSGFAFFGTAICLLNMYTFFLSDLCFPDMLYGLLTVGFLVTHSGASRLLSARWAGLFAVAAFAARTAGIALLVAWVGESLLRREWRAAIGRAVFAIIPVVAWFSYVHGVEASAEYQHPTYAYQRADYMFYNVSYATNLSLNDPFDPDLGYSTAWDRIDRLSRNLLAITRYVGESVSARRRVWEIERETLWQRFGGGVQPEWVIDLPLFLLGGLVLAGAGLMAAQGQRLIPLCILSSILVVSHTPWPEQFNRYLMPTVPLLSLSLCIAIMSALKTLKFVSHEPWKRTGRVLLYVVMTGIVLQQVATAVAVYANRLLPVHYQDHLGGMISYRLFFYLDSYRALDAGVDWLMGRADSRDVIAVSMPHWVYVRTGNKTVMPPFESDPSKAQQLLESVPVTYLILDEGLAIDSKRFMKGVVERFPDRWIRVYRDDIVTETGDRHEQAFEIYKHVSPGPALVQPEPGSVLPVHQTVSSSEQAS